LTGKLPVDSVARIDLGRRIRIGRPGTPVSGRPAADSPAQVDPALPGTICDAESTGVKHAALRT
jgi:hypothetical protein